MLGPHPQVIVVSRFIATELEWIRTLPVASHHTSRFHF